MGNIKRDIGLKVWARYTNIGNIDIYKPILANFRINRSPTMTDRPERLATELKISLTEEQQLLGLKEKYFIYQSPYAVDNEEDKILFFL